MFLTLRTYKATQWYMFLHDACFTVAKENIHLPEWLETEPKVLELGDNATRPWSMAANPWLLRCAVGNAIHWEFRIAGEINSIPWHSRCALTVAVDDWVVTTSRFGATLYRIHDLHFVWNLSSIEHVGFNCVYAICFLLMVKGPSIFVSYWYPKAQCTVQTCKATAFEERGKFTCFPM